MTKIDIFSGFLGAGKTTLIKKLLKEAYAGEQLVLIENEFGEIGIDGGFMQDAGVRVTEMNSGCICCSLVGDFGRALCEVIDTYAPDRILIEPSGVGKLSDIIRAVQGLEREVLLNGFTTVADVKKCKMYMKNFGEFFNDQIAHAGCIVLSHTQDATDEKIAETVALLREKNASAVIVTTPWDRLDGAQLLLAMERKDTIAAELERLASHVEECDDPECECHHHHHEHKHGHHEHHEHEHHGHEHHEHEHHEHEPHEHHHDGEECHDPHCSCHHHEHEHEHGHGHHHHHADEVFTSWGVETVKRFDEEGLRALLLAFEDANRFGTILRAKGIVESADGGEWIHFDYIPGEVNIRRGSAGIIGRLCVIGSHICEHTLGEHFGVEHRA